MSYSIPSTAGFVGVDTTTTKTILLPLTTERIGRIIEIKDRTGNASVNPITVQTQNPDTFENGGNTYVINQSFGAVSFIARNGQWLRTQAIEVIPASLTSSIVGLGTLGYISTSFYDTNTLSTVKGLGTAGYLSTISFSNLISTSFYDTNTLSTVKGLGTAGYLSSAGATQGALTSSIIGLGTVGYLSTISFSNIISTSFYDTNTLSTVKGLGTAGYISSAGASQGALTSSILGLGTAGYYSTLSELSTVRGLGTAGYLSTISFSNIISTSFYDINTTSTIKGLGTAGYLSTASGANQDAITSSIIGLGTTGYISSLQLYSTVAGLTSNISTTYIDPTELASSVLQFISSTYFTTQFQSTVRGLGTAGYLSTVSFSNVISTSFYDINTTSTIKGLGTAGYLSTASGANQDAITSSIKGLGTVGYLSTVSFSNVISTSFYDTFTTSTIKGLGTAGYLSTASGANQDAITSSIKGLGTVGYLSTVSFSNVISTSFYDNFTASTVRGLGTAGYYSTLSELSTVRGLGTAGYVSTTYLQQYISTFSTGISSNFYGNFAFICSMTVSSLAFAGSGTGYLNFPDIRTTGISTFAINTSSINAITITGGTYFGLGSQLVGLPAVSTLSLTSTIVGLGTAGYISSSQLNSSLVGLGTAGYISSSQLYSTVLGLNSNISTGYIDPNELTSTLLQFISSPYLTTQFQSTVRGLGTVGYLSTVSFSNVISTSFYDTNTLSTVKGLGTAGYLSTASGANQDAINSSIKGLGTAGYLSTISFSNVISTSFYDTFTTSTIKGLGTAGYLSTASGANQDAINSSIKGLGTAGYLSTVSFSNVISTSFYDTNTLSTIKGLGTAGYLSTVSFSNIISTSFYDTNTRSTVIGLGTANYISSSQLYSTVAGLTSNISTQSIDNSELVSSVRGLGTAGYLSTVSFSNVISTSFYDTNTLSTVKGLGTAGYASTSYVLQQISTFSTGISSNFYGNFAFICSMTVSSLAFAGSGTGYLNFPDIRTTGISTFAINTSSINAITITGGTYFGNGSQLVGLPAISTLSLNSSITGLGTAGYISSSQLYSSLGGLGTAGYISSAQLYSTVAGLTSNISTTYIDPTELASSVLQFISSTYFTTQFQSTVRGLGTAGYLSTVSFSNVISTSFYDTNTLSTVKGLGTAGYLSTVSFSNVISTSFYDTNTTSTVRGLGTAGFLSSISFSNIISTSFYDTNTLSTVKGLGTVGYLSSFNAFTMSTGRITTSTLTFFDINTQASQQLLVSSGVLTLNGQAIGGGSGGGSAGLTISEYVVAGKLNADQVLTANTDNDIQFVDDFDPQNWYNAGTYRLAPTIAGYYIMSYQVWFQNIITTNNQINIQIQKNGTDTYTITQFQQFSTTGLSLNTTKILYMNGNTDYVKFRAYVGNTSNTNVVAAYGATSYGQGTFFTASLLTNGTGSGNLVSTVAGLGNAGYISTSFYNVNTTSTLIGLGTAGYISSAGASQGAITSSIIGLGTAGYLSTTSLNNYFSSFSTSYGRFFFSQSAAISSLTLQNFTSVQGYVSSLIVDSLQFGDGNGWVDFGAVRAVAMSTVQLNANIGYFTQLSTSLLIANSLQGDGSQLINLPAISTLSLASTIRGLGTAGYLSTVSFSNIISTSFYDTNTLSTVKGLGTAGYLSTISFSNIISTSFYDTNTASTVRGLGTANYISSSQLYSTVAGLTSNISSTYIDPTELASSVLQFISSTYFTTQFQSTVAGLGTAGYLSTVSFSNVISTSFYNTNTTSTIIGLGTANYISSSQLYSTVAGLTSNISSLFIDPTELASSVLQFISSGFLATQFQSTVKGLGTSGYLSTVSFSNVISTSFYDTNTLSTVKGLGTAGYLSTTLSSFYLSSLFTNLVQTSSIWIANRSGGPFTGASAQDTNYQLLISDASLYYRPTTLPLPASFPGTLVINQNYLTSNINSTITGLGTAGYISSAGANQGAITSTIIGLGTAGYLSTVSFSNVISTSFYDTNTASTVRGLGTAGYISSAGANQGAITSTVIGLGTAGYLSTVSFSNVISTSFYDTNTLSTVKGLGTAGYLSTVSFSNVISTSFYDTNTLSTVKGLGTANYISSSQLYSTVAGLTSNISTLYIDPTELASSVLQFISSGYLTTQFQSTVKGLGTAGYLSTVSFSNVISTSFYDTNTTSTIIGLGTANYISSSQLYSTVAGLTSNISSFIDPQELASSVLQFISSGYLATQFQSTVKGLGTAGYLSTVSFSNVISTSFYDMNTTSSIIGLGTANYISSSQLYSTVAGLTSNISSFIDPIELASSVLQFISSTYFATQFQSTVKGLGTAGYLSTVSFSNVISTSFYDTNTLSTVKGLGTAGYVSSFVPTQLLVNSTIAGLGTLAYLSSVSFSNVISTSFYDTNTLSTVKGLGTAGYISSASYDTNTVSTVKGLGTAGYLSTTLSSFFLSSLFTNLVQTSSIWIANRSGGPFTGGNAQDTNYQLLVSDASLYYRPTTFPLPASFPGILMINQNYLTSNINSTITGLGTAGYISSAGANQGAITSTVIGLGTAGYLSTVSFSNVISTSFYDTNTLSTVKGLGTAGYISSAGANQGAITSTVIGLGTVGYLSTISFSNVISTSFYDTNTLSTVKGLGTANYISSSQLYSTVAGLTSNISSFIDPIELASSVLQFISSGYFATQFQSTVKGLGTAGYLSTVSFSNVISTSFYDTNTLSTVKGLGTVGYLSTVSFSNVISTSFYDTNTTSTIIGLGTANYISSSQLYSTVVGLTSNISSFIDPTELASSVLQFISSGYFATQFQSTVKGLGTAGYLSTVSFSNVISTSFYDTNTLSTVKGLGTVGYLSTVSFSNVISTSFYDTNTTSTIIGLGTANYISSSQLYSTVVGLTSNISSFIDPIELASSVLQFISSGYFATQFQSTVKGLGTAGYLSTVSFSNVISTSFYDTNTLSTVKGLGTAGYLSTVSFSNIISTSFYDTNTLSTVKGLGTAGYLSTVSFSNVISTSFYDTNTLSTVKGLGTAGYLSTVSFSNVISTSFYDTNTLSTVKGLGTANYISSSQLYSTVAGLTSNISSFIDPIELASSVLQFISSGYFATQFQSTVKGLGTAGYLSTVNLSNLISTSFYDTNTLSTVKGLGTAGYLSTTLSSFYLSSLFTNLVQTSSIWIANRSGGPFTGGNAQDTNYQLLVSDASLYFRPTTLAVPSIFPGTLVINQTYLTSNINSTVTGLGTIGYLSSINFSNFISTSFYNTTTTSTVIGLGTANYISSSQLYSTVAGLTSNISTLYIDPAELASSVLQFISSGYLTTQFQSTVKGLGTAGYLSTVSFSNVISTSFYDTNTTSTVIGLGTANYISSSQLYSTVAGLTSNISSFIDPIELASSVLQFISSGYFATQFQSTVKGLGTAGYLSTVNLSNLVSTSFYDTNTLSTVKGLGTAGYLSTVSFSNIISTSFYDTNTTSTIVGLGTANYISSSQLYSTVAGLTSNISSFIDPQELASSVLQFISSSFLATQFQSTVRGLGTAGYLSTVSFSNVISTSFYDTNTTSTIIGLGTANYISSSQLYSTVVGLTSNISSFIDPIELASSVLQFISSGYFATQFQSTVKGLGTAGYLSTVSFSNVISTSFYDTFTTSTVKGLGTVGYISSLQLISTVAGLGNIYNSSPTTSTIRLSTGTVTLSTLAMIDTSLGTTTNLYVSSTLLYYGCNVVAGTRVLQPLFITF